MYGLMIAIGALAAVALARRRWEARGGDPNDISAIAMWAIPAGLIGARLYHVATDWKRYEISMDVPAGIVNINFGLLFPAKQGEGTVWFDDLRIDPGLLGCRLRHMDHRAIAQHRDPLALAPDGRLYTPAASC